MSRSCKDVGKYADEVVRLYATGKSLSNIAKQIGCISMTSVHAILVRRGIPRRSNCGSVEGATINIATQRMLKNTVLSSDPDGCFTCTMGTSSGYPSIGISRPTRTRIRSHRLSWMYFLGEIPKGKYILHTCDNRRCIRPDHLFLGTHLDNIRDMVSKGRNQKGETHSRAKLKEIDVINIRKDLKLGVTPASVSVKYGISNSHVFTIKNKRNWRDVGNEV